MSNTKKLLAFIAIDIACFLTILDSTIVNVSLPNMATHFNTSTTGISWVSTAYLIAFSALLINFSKIADIFGRKKLFIIGLVIFGASSVLCGFVDTLPLLITFRVIQGIGAAILTPLPIPLGIELYGKDSLGKLSVIVGLTISVSAALGPLVGGILNEFFSYRAIFYVNIPFIILSIILGGFYVVECYDETISKKIDFIGCILLSVAIGALTFVLVKGNAYGWFSKKSIILILCVIICSVLFVVFENKIKEPMIDFSLFKIRSFTTSILLIGIFFYAYMPISYLVNFFFENTLEFSVLKAGLFMGVPSLAALISTPLISLLSKILNVKAVSILSVICAVSGNILLVFLHPENHMMIICISFVIIGIGIRITTTLYQTAFEEVAKDKNGIASGILNSFRQLTACIAIALVSTLSSHYTEIATENTKNAIINEVNANSILDNTIKTAFIEEIETSDNNSSFNTDDIKTKIHNLLLSYEETSYSQAITTEQIAAITATFESWEYELNVIVDYGQAFKTDEIYNVYNKCFLITGLLALTGFIVVPFSSKKVTS